MDDFLIDTGTFQLSQTDFIIRLFVAIGIGAIIGLEREHAAIKEKTESFAGIRTFIMVLVLGFVGSMTFYVLSPWVYFSIILVVGILTGISYWFKATGGDIGTTTDFTVLIGFLLGGLSFLGYITISLMITVVVVVVLSSKPKLHFIIGKITEDELYDFIRYVVVALLVFPFLPDRNFGPNNILNPREIGWVILLTSGLGFIGYLLMKFLGAKRGILLSGIVGGLVSSTAVTWVFAKKSKENDEHSHSCAIAILAASSIMIIRVLVLIFVFNKALFDASWLAFSLVFVAAIGVTVFLYIKQKGSPKIETSFRQNKPLDLQGAILFGVIYTVVLLVVNYANEHLGEKGLIVSSGFAGLSDIDAITISVSKLAGAKLDYSLALKAVLIATISNTLVKMGIGIWAGSIALRKYLYIGYGMIFLTAILVYLWL
ncbi:MgtC/SapB family protein [Flavihumibacter fluvii]|uniref:MgtC/SapB family protein n=1 Tax=Flavihumibacter fluvii TaxID=2838157 RepID=UPI001BDDCDEE|nr:MgtC/SapB family protein [Flavihumibacter fluvii]ULQ52790.1 MgtC/SapB family protein [Flavihumibacter fluvii]